jgi:hypothetical protein
VRSYQFVLLCCLQEVALQEERVIQASSSSALIALAQVDPPEARRQWVTATPAWLRVMWLVACAW